MEKLQPRFVGVDLFAGAGGMTVGARMAGIEVVACVENDPYATETYRCNNPGVTIFSQDIRSWHSLPATAKGDVRVLFGGPPCQGFSTSNQRTRSSANPENFLFAEFLRVASEWQPDWVVFENVKGIAETESGAFLETILARVAKLGYKVSHGFLQAMDHGVPQRRTRLFIVGSKKGVEFKLPAPTTDVHLTVWDAISDLPRLANAASTNYLPYRYPARNDYQKSMRNGLERCANHLVSRNSDLVIERYLHIPQGCNWEAIPDRLMGTYADKTKCHTGIYHRLAENKPSVVIGNYRKNMLIHPRQDRGLSVREAARLQSFPDNYEFKGSIGFQQQQVGNAVPPLLSEAVFKAMMDAHFGTLQDKAQPLTLAVA